MTKSVSWVTPPSTDQLAMKAEQNNCVSNQWGPRAAFWQEQLERNTYTPYFHVYILWKKKA